MDDLTLLPGSRTVLVVDDTSAVRITAFRMLSEAGFRVFEAASAAEALEVLQTARRPVDLIVMDVVMPEVSGVDLVHTIKDRWPDIPVLFMSGYQAEVLVREGLERPDVLFLAKPFTRAELLSKVVGAIRNQSKRNGQSARKGREQ
ncbi:MAG: response regulator [Gemmatimonadota bacterium]